MGKKYKKPPVVEALCEFEFIPEKSWDITIFGLFYEKIKKEFPVKKQQTAIGFELVPKKGGLEQRIEMAIPRMQFLRKDETALVQVSTNLLVINHLIPYSGWEKFKYMILENLNHYIKVAGPKGFKRVGLRYINKIDIPIKSIKIEDYFNFYLRTPDELSKMPSNFNIKIEIPYEIYQGNLILSLGNIISVEKDNISIILDLHYMSIAPLKVSFEDVGDWIENAHTIIEEAFESSITDQCRELFEEVKK